MWDVRFGAWVLNVVIPDLVGDPLEVLETRI